MTWVDRTITYLLDLSAEGLVWLEINLFETARLVEFAAVFLSLLLARLGARLFWKLGVLLVAQYWRQTGPDKDDPAAAIAQDQQSAAPVDPLEKPENWEGLKGIAAKLPLLQRSVLPGVLALILLSAARFILTPLLGPLLILPLAVSLLAAWVAIRVFASFIAHRELARLTAWVIWSLAALNILGILPVLVQVLDGAVIPLGEARISLLDIGAGILSFSLLIWGALVLAGLIENQLKNLSRLPATIQVLIAKSGRIILLAIAFLLSLDLAGIDLTALAVFGGALGVGIGFGLQKVVSNFISGLILLLDRSIKPGDVVETGGTYGRINKLAARYTSVITRDGTEFLIPNEDMITQTVINWSHTDLLVRRRIPIQVAYHSDLRQAMALAVAASLEEKRVLKKPEPRCLLRGFGESGVDLELRFWIKDPENGVSNIASEIMLHIWDKYHEAGIEFPYPQRVVHLKKDA